MWAEGEMNDSDARLWHPWLRINRVLRVMLHTRRSAERGHRSRQSSRRRSRGATHLGELGFLGITLVVATVVGFAGGYWLGTAPWLAMIGLGFGIAAGFVNLFRAVKRH